MLLVVNALLTVDVFCRTTAGLNPPVDSNSLMDGVPEMHPNVIIKMTTNYSPVLSLSQTLKTC